MREKVLVAGILLIVFTIHIGSAISATGTITGRIVSTTISVNDISFEDLDANPDQYYYKTATGIGRVTLNNQASGIIPFATIDFAFDTGSIQIGLGPNTILPGGAKIILDDDTTPNSEASDPNQIQITGNSQNQAVITYKGQNGDDKIVYTSDGYLYVFINTGSASSGDINVDITVSS